jgi:arsenate reductase
MLSEGVATFGLVAVILAGLRFERGAVPWLAGLCITAAYWFTASPPSPTRPWRSRAPSPTPSRASGPWTCRPSWWLSPSARSPSCRGSSREPRPSIALPVPEASNDRHDLPQPCLRQARIVLALIRASGEEPEVIEYLVAPPSHERLLGLIAEAGLTVREAIRQKGTPYDGLGLADPALTDNQLLDARLLHPILINRPFVVGPTGTRLARPSEVVLEVIEKPVAEFAKEDGEVVRAPARNPGKGATRD